jgi:hypothetical protein
MGMPFGSSYFAKKTGLIDSVKSRIGAEEILRCLMFGRAKMSLSAEQIAYLSNTQNLPPELLGGWSDDFLKYMGCDEVDTLDYSDFEGANVTWNLNRNIAEHSGFGELRGKYHVILDYGTSEHVFNPAMSVLNAIQLLACGGVLNLMLPVVGWVDHGFVQFSQSFFYSIGREELKLNNLYFFIPDYRKAKLTYWDGLSEEFREHVHGAFDGSFAANGLEFLDKQVLAWATYVKIEDLNSKDFLENTQQEIYKMQWGANAKYSTDPEKLRIYNSNKFIRRYLIQKYMRQICQTVE